MAAIAIPAVVPETLPPVVEFSPLVPSKTLPLPDAALVVAAAPLPVADPPLARVEPGVRGMAGLM